MDHHKRKYSQFMDTDPEQPPTPTSATPVSHPQNLLRMPSVSELGLADLSVTDEGTKMTASTNDQKSNAKGKEPLRHDSRKPTVDSTRTSPDYAPTPTPSPSTSPMSDIQPAFAIPNLSLNDDGEWQTTNGLSPADFRTLLDTAPPCLLRKVVVDSLTNEYIRLFNVLTNIEEEFTEWDFDVQSTLAENKEDWRIELDHFEQALTHMNHWRDNRDECRTRQIPMEARFVWDDYFANLEKLEKMCVEAQKEALKAMEKSQRKGRFRSQVVLGKLAQRNGRSVVEGEGMGLGLGFGDGRGRRVEEEERRAREE